MIELIKPGTKFDFVSKFNIALVMSTILVITGIVLVFTKMNYGVDFRGGAEVQIKFAKTIELENIRKTITDGGFKGSSVQTIGEPTDNEFLIKVQAEATDLNAVANNMGETFKKVYGNDVEIRKVDIVGPKAGAQLRLSGFLAMGWAMLAIMIYLGLRFDIKYAPGAVIALFHDTAIVCGIFALTGKEFTLQIVAAILAIIGYSVNDTVIVYDRVREHENKFPGIDLKTHINLATNETLSRTVMTSGATLLVCITMFLLGGPVIEDFFFTMSLGILVGTYSSIFIASPITLGLDKLLNKKKKV